MVLVDYKLVVEFPRGATLCLPSAVCKHSNTHIQDGETHAAFTQYSAEGLFRYVDHRFQTWKTLASKKDSKSRRLVSQLKKTRKTHWTQKASLFSKIEGLHQERRDCGMVSASDKEH